MLLAPSELFLIACISDEVVEEVEGVECMVTRRLVLVGGSRLRTMFSVVCNGEFPRLGTSGILGIRWVGEGSCSSF